MTLIKNHGENESPFLEFESFDSVPAEHVNKGIKDTMFASNYDESIRS